MTFFRLSALLLLLAATINAQRLTMASHTLTNGMKIIVHEDHDIPNVAMHLFFRIGSRNERPGATGMSHFFEHMMFNGAKKYGPKQFDVQMEDNGGRNNGYTTRDVTVYTNWFPNTALELMFDMEADRIRDLSFEPKIIESERGVVYSERRTMVDNNNFGITHEQLFANAFQAHPYHWPVIGWASDIEAWTIDDLKQHFQTGYAPNNCVLVLSGAVKEEEVLRLAKKYLEPIPRQEPPAAPRTKEPEQLGERRATVRKAAQAPLLAVGYHAPPASHADSPALELLARLLTRGRSSRLYRRLVDREQLVLNVQSIDAKSLDPGLLIFMAQARPGRDPAAAEKSMYEELDRLGREPVDDAEIQKTRNQMLVEFYREIRTIAGKANLIGTAEVLLGDHRRINSLVPMYEKVTAADLQRVAKQYLTEKNRTVVTLLPENGAGK